MNRERDFRNLIAGEVVLVPSPGISFSPVFKVSEVPIEHVTYNPWKYVDYQYAFITPQPGLRRGYVQNVEPLKDLHIAIFAESCVTSSKMPKGVKSLQEIVKELLEMKYTVIRFWNKNDLYTWLNKR